MNSKTGLHFGLILFGSVLGLLALEIGLRIFWPRSQGLEFQSVEDIRASILGKDSPKSQVQEQEAEEKGNLKAIVNPHPNDKIIYDLKPNLNTSFQGVPLHTNSCGLRGKEYGIPKPPKVFRIALLGDSFAFGWGVKAEETFASRLENNLNHLSRGAPKVEVLNFGIPGYSTFQEVAKFIETGLDFNPDALLAFFVQNDFGLPFYVRDIYQPGGLLSALNFARLSWKREDPLIETQRLELLGLDSNSALRELSQTCKERGIPLYLALNPHRDWKEDKDKLWVLKREKYIRLILLRSSFMRVVRERNLVAKDLNLPHDPHPSPLRHDIYGDLLTPYFMGYLTK